MKKKLLTATSLLLLVTLLSGCFGRSETPSQESSEQPTSLPSTPTSTPTSEGTSVSEEPTSDSEEPSSEILPMLTISNKETFLWLDETLTILTEVIDGAEEEVGFTSSDELIATVSEAGVVTPLKMGEVTITAYIIGLEEIKDTLPLEIKDTVLDTAFGFGNYDYTLLKSENPSVVTTKVNAEWPYAEAVYKNVSGQRYYAEVTVDVTEINTGWIWNRLSIGHRDAVLPEEPAIFRGLNLSYGDGTTKKTVIMETPNNWGETTDRSQVWGLNGISDIAFGVGESVTLATLRDGNNYYYFINNRLMWFEKYDERFLGKDTAPSVVLHDYHGKLHSMFATKEAAFIDEKLALADTNREIYPTMKENVVIDSEAKTIVFQNANAGWPFSNIKDTAAKSVGDAFSFPNDINAKLSFKFKFDSLVDPDISILAITLNHWGKDGLNRGPNRAITFSFGANGAGITEWDSNGDLPVTPGTPLAYPTPLAEENTVTIERLLVDGENTFKIILNGEEIANTFLAPSYTNAYILSFGARTANITISDYLITV